jgi:CRP-like cAMP-binding protein
VYASIWSNIFRLSRKKETLGETLHGVPLFQDLSPKELRILERVVHLRAYHDTETVFDETEPGAGMYVIQSGRVDLNARSESPLILAELRTGDFFGEMALLGETTRSATAVARGRAELIGFFHPDLLEIIDLHPGVGAKICYALARTLAERLRYTNMQLRDIWEIRGPHETTIR